MFTSPIYLSPNQIVQHAAPRELSILTPLFMGRFAVQETAPAGMLKSRSRHTGRLVTAQRVKWVTQRNQSGIGRRHDGACHQVYIQGQDSNRLQSYSEEEFRTFMGSHGVDVRYTSQTLFADIHLMKHLTAGKQQGTVLAVNHQPPLFLAVVNARVGWGAFALRDIREGEVIGRYTGVICEIEQGNTYSMACPLLGETFMIDATHFGNETRYVNHSDYPNCIFLPARTADGIPEMLLTATCPIPRGQQLLTDYGDEYWQGIVPEKL